MSRPRSTSEKLRDAIIVGDDGVVRKILEANDASLRQPRALDKPHPTTNLALAAIYGQINVMQALLELEHDCDSFKSLDNQSNTILHMLAGPLPGYIKTDPSRILRAIETYAHRFQDMVDWVNAQGQTALHLAIMSGSVEIVKLLAGLGADFQLPDAMANMPLHLAAAYGHVQICAFLLEHKADINQKNAEGYTAADIAYDNKTALRLADLAKTQRRIGRMRSHSVIPSAPQMGKESPSGRSRAQSVVGPDERPMVTITPPTLPIFKAVETPPATPGRSRKASQASQLSVSSANSPTETNRTRTGLATSLSSILSSPSKHSSKTDDDKDKSKDHIPPSTRKLFRLGRLGSHSALDKARHAAAKLGKVDKGD